MQLKVHKLTPEAVIPYLSSDCCAGLELEYSRAENIVVPHLGRVVVPIDITLTCGQMGVYFRIASCSETTLTGLDIIGTVMDCNFSGPVQVVVINLSGSEIIISQYSQIAQLIVECIMKPVVITDI